MFISFNPCVLWLLLALHIYVAISLAMSCMYYDIIRGFVSSYTAILARHILGDSSMV
jgi:hypothetical protein